MITSWKSERCAAAKWHINHVQGRACKTLQFVWWVQIAVWCLESSRINTCLCVAWNIFLGNCSRIPTFWHKMPPCQLPKGAALFAVSLLPPESAASLHLTVSEAKPFLCNSPNVFSPKHSASSYICRARIKAMITLQSWSRGVWLCSHVAHWRALWAALRQREVERHLGQLTRWAQRSMSDGCDSYLPFLKDCHHV